MGKNIYILIHTSLGWVGILGDTNGRISRLVLPLENRYEAFCKITEGATEAVVESEHDFALLSEKIIAYFEGEVVNFECDLDLSIGSDFDRLVWAATSKIGYGDVRSYAWVAEKIGKPKAYRAIGRALAKNPVPLIIPCHRVIRTNGSLGGFRYGASMKAKLLELERAAVV
ncbi:MAG: methylated-DNA--[protein]-cysteine S-methyltransferase [Armatimonadota bacterium]|nr:methylated-DNA--[protein]-cysteine S-methyltransferase [Armatimonadota bacterium]